MNMLCSAASLTIFIRLCQSLIFKPTKVKEVLTRALKERIEGQKYDPVKGSQASAPLPEPCRMPQNRSNCQTVPAASQAAGRRHQGVGEGSWL